MPAPQLTISIVHHSNRDLLRDCLRSLYALKNEVEFETILVDNVSSEGALEMVREEFPAVRVIENTARKGFGANHNQALRASGGRFILLLNDDTLVQPNALRALCEYLEHHPEVGAVGPRLENPDGTLQPSCYKFPSPLRALMENLLLVAALPSHEWIGDYRAWPHDEEREVDFVSGAALVIRREVLDTAGFFDENFFMYAEETDWCYRMKESGWKVAFTPNATIVHYGGQSSVDFKERQFVEFHRSQARYLRKHFGPVGLACARAATISGALLRITLWSVVLVAAVLGLARTQRSDAGRYAQREEARRTVREWRRILKWWMGHGPHEGIAELACLRNTAPEN
jgi:GT2 family glycosyltransferase